MEPVGETSTPLWREHAVFRGQHLLFAVKELARVSNLNELPEIAWGWNNLVTNSRIKTIEFSDMKEPIMCLKESNQIVGVAFKYLTDNFFDYDPSLKKKAHVVKVIALTDRLEETTRTTQSSEFRVKDWIDCREASIMEEALWKDAPPSSESDLRAPLYMNRVVLKYESLTLTLLSLAKVGQIDSLPLLNWSWKNLTSYEIQPISFNQMTHNFMSLKWKGLFIAIAVRYIDDSYYDAKPVNSYRATLVKVYLIAKNQIVKSFTQDEYNNIFTVQDFMDAHDAYAINRFLKANLS